MDRRIRIMAILLVACFCLLFVQLNNWQIRQSGSLANSKFQPSPPTPNVFDQPRGDIISSDGTVLADSTPTADGGEQRNYPNGPLFAAVTGYYDVTQFAAPLGIESYYNDQLLVHQSTASNLSELLTQHNGTDSVVLTISDKLQQAAATALDGEIGAVVAIQPQTGAVLAMYSSPTYDPNKLSSHDANAVAKYFKSLDPNSYSSPIVNYATDHPIAPGSTFKVITTATVYDHNPTVADTIWPVQRSIPLKNSNKTLQNFGGEACGGSLAAVLASSCDTAYAQIGIKLGGNALADEANAFGFNKQPPIDLPSTEVAKSNFPSGPSIQGNDPITAYSSIGQENVTETALQDALVAAGIGNEGRIMTPHLLAHVVDDQGTIVKSYQSTLWKQATTSETADTVRQLMTGVVSGKGGTAANVGFLPDLHVAAKTGTAETGATGCSATWLIATAPAGPTDVPKIAIAAVLPSQARVSCGETGAEAAGPVVKAVMDSYFGISK